MNSRNLYINLPIILSLNIHSGCDSTGGGDAPVTSAFCWIGTGSSRSRDDFELAISEVLANDSFKIKRSAASIRGRYILNGEYAERLVFIIPHSFGVTPSLIYDGDFEAGVDVVTRPLTEGGEEYDFFYTSGLIADTHEITIK